MNATTDPFYLVIPHAISNPELIGPFGNPAEANAWAKTHRRIGVWHVVKLETPAAAEKK